MLCSHEVTEGVVGFVDGGSIVVCWGRLSRLCISWLIIENKCSSVFVTVGVETGKVEKLIGVYGGGLDWGHARADAEDVIDSSLSL